MLARWSSAHGMPQRDAAYLEQAHTLDAGEPPANAQPDKPPSPPVADWRAILALLEDRRFLDPADWDALRDAAAHTARFSFQTSRALQTLGITRAPAEPPPAMP